ncbi:hypothetical protein BH18GEM1_BH18GEM1_08160 [soil metagenome]
MRRSSIDAPADFELRVLPRPGRGYGLALFQAHLPNENGSDDPELVVRIWGRPLQSVLDQVLSTLKRSGYRAIDLHAGRRAPFRVPEEEGVRLGLLFLALKPLRRSDRIEAIGEHVRTMETEELYYWFSKVTSSEIGRRANRSLRIMMADE